MAGSAVHSSDEEKSHCCPLGHLPLNQEPNTNQLCICITLNNACKSLCFYYHLQGMPPCISTAIFRSPKVMMAHNLLQFIWNCLPFCHLLTCMASCLIKTYIFLYTCTCTCTWTFYVTHSSINLYHGKSLHLTVMGDHISR